LLNIVIEVSFVLLNIIRRFNYKSHEILSSWLIMLIFGKMSKVKYFILLII